MMKERGDDRRRNRREIENSGGQGEDVGNIVQGNKREGQMLKRGREVLNFSTFFFQCFPFRLKKLEE